MKISYNWLREITGIQQSPAEISELLTNCGLEVEGIREYSSIPGRLEGIVVGEVLTVNKHPNADKLSITTVNTGNGEIKQIVCGAPNVAAGQKVLIACVGSTVHPLKGEPFMINKSKIRGEVSEGMICAEDELGLGDSHTGIMVLPSVYVAGKKASDYFPVYTDFVFEIGLTANRGDAASHLGVARDLKALLNIHLHVPEYSIAGKNTNKAIQVSVEDTDGCLRYSGVSISNIQVKESPEWIKNRLKSIGLTPINNIVDATNYVLHDLGQPLHAFDSDKISGHKIVVKKVSAGTKFTTLDKIERTLNGNECMICDTSKPLVIAGVFGGIDSGVTENTTSIFIESAYFSPVPIRKAAKHHGLSTDASFRFERGTDPNMTLKALGRVAQIILEIAGGEISSLVTDIYPQPISNQMIDFSVENFNSLIGQVIPIDVIRKILSGLEIEIISENDSLWSLSIPPYRSDVKREADIAEDILRIYGLNKINIPDHVQSAIVFSEDEKGYKLRNKISDFLSATGFHELINNSLTSPGYYSKESLTHAVHILNPLSNELSIMRMNMLYSGLETVRFNRNRKSMDLKLFEFGYTYTKDKSYTEVPHLSIYLCGNDGPETWIQPQSKVNYFSIKSVMESICRKSGIVNPEFEFHVEHNYILNCTRIHSQNKLIAEFGAVDSKALAAFDIDCAVYFGNVFWNQVVELSATSTFELQPVSAFPHVRRDLALLLDKKITYAEIEKIALKTSPGLIKQINPFDVYEGDKIDSSMKSYAISFILQDDTKTLTDQEIESVMNKLIRQFENELGAKLRS